MHNALIVQVRHAGRCSLRDRQQLRRRQIKRILSVESVNKRSFVAKLDHDGQIAVLENSGAEKVDNIRVVLQGEGRLMNTQHSNNNTQ